MATVPDAFGIGARWQGAGGAGVAVVEDGTAALVNPAGLSRVRRPTASLGITAAFPKFRDIPDLWWDTNRDGVVDERDPPLAYSANVEPPIGLSVSAARNIGGKFGLGITAYVPTSQMIRFAMFEPELPNYFMWNNRMQRFVAAAGVGGEVLPGLSIGVSVDILAKANVNVVMTLDAAVAPPAEGADELSDVVGDVVIDVHDISLSVVPAFAPVLGMQFDVGKVLPVLDGLVLGASYHGSVGLPINVDLDLQFNVATEDLGDLEPYVASIIADASLSLFDHYVPPKLMLGLAFRRSNTLTMYVDTRWTDWRKLTLNVARLESADLISPLVDLSEGIQDGNEHKFVVRPVWSLRMGADLALPEWVIENDLRYVRLFFRGGFGLEPSPLVEQTELSALLDANRTMFTTGAGVEFWDPFELNDGPVRYDLFFQYHVLAETTMARSHPTPKGGYPVTQAGLPVGGRITVFGAQWSFDY
jgi:hypothetical protein